MASPLVSRNDGERQQGRSKANGTFRRPSRPLIPAVPRALEKNRQRSSTGEQTSTSRTNSIVKAETSNDAAGNGACGGCDWASMVVEAQENDEIAKMPADTQAATDLHFEDQAGTDSRNHSFLQVPGAEKQHEEDRDEPAVLMPHMNGEITNGFSNNLQPESTSPCLRFEPDIVFGGSVVSNQSSPTMPPSTSSTTYTQPTPVSDIVSSHSQSLYQGYGHATTLTGHMPPKSPQVPMAHAAQGSYPPAPLSNGNEPKYVPSHSRRSTVFEHPGSLNSMAMTEALHTYLLGQFNDPSMADCILDLQVRAEHARVFVHSVIIARSPTLRNLLISGATRDASGRTNIVLRTKDRFVTIPALISSLKSCYGAYPSLPGMDSAAVMPPLSEGQAKLLMEDCLASIAASHILQLVEFAIFGTESASQMLSRSNLESALAFGLDKSASPYEPPLEYGLALPSANGNSTYAPYSDELLRNVIGVLLSNISTSFELDASAPPSSKLGGIPVSQDAPDIGHKRISSNPKLSFIHFGELNSSSTTDPQTTLMSTILLSVPFDFLYHLLRMIARPSITKATVVERERRRARYLQHISTECKINAMDAAAVRARANWEEDIDETGVGIFKRWAGRAEISSGEVASEMR